MAALLLAATFFTFIIQIVARYLLNLPIGWTVELSGTIWLWLVLWTCAFCLREGEHVKFDVVYSLMGPKMRRRMAIVSAIVVVVALVAALPASWDYVSFYDIKKSTNMRLRLDYVFSIYLVFVVVVIARYAWTIISLLRRPLDGGTDSDAGGAAP